MTKLFTENWTHSEVFHQKFAIIFSLISPSTFPFDLNACVTAAVATAIAVGAALLFLLVLAVFDAFPIQLSIPSVKIKIYIF